MRPSNQQLRELNPYLQNKTDEELDDLVATIESSGYVWVEDQQQFFNYDMGKGVKTSGLDFFDSESFIETQEEWTSEEWIKTKYYNRLFFRSLFVSAIGAIILFAFVRWELGLASIAVGIAVSIYASNRKNHYIKQREIKSGNYVDTSKIEWCLTCKHFKKVSNYEDSLHYSQSMLTENQIPCKIQSETNSVWEEYFSGNLDDRYLYPKNCTHWIKK